ncbi:hypothetical protein A3762_18335, partial [Oleiphilus sp. HI0125]
MKSPNLYAGTVLINGADTITGYNAARSIAGQGFKIYGQATNPQSLYLKSKIWRNVFIEEALPSKLIKLSTKILENEPVNCFKPVLILNQDMAVERAAKAQSELGQHFQFQLPTQQNTLRMLDKTEFETWASQNDICTPKSYIAATPEDVRKALRSLDYPIVIKPLVRTPAWDALHPHNKAFKLNEAPQPVNGTENHTESFYTELLKLTDRLIIQEWINGGDHDVYFVLAHIGKTKTTSLCGRKITQWPRLTGSTSMCVTHIDPELEQLGLSILNKAGLKGLGSVEFKKDQTRNQYYVTEPTVGRNDYQSYIASASNINLNLYYVLDCLGYHY